MSEQSTSENNGINRREVLLGIGAAAATAYAGNAVAAMPGHDHSKHKAQHPDLLAAVHDCTSKGERCIAHCLVSFQEGDTELADCAAKVHEMQAVCNGFSYLVASNSGYIGDYAKVCRQVCMDCEKECLKHKEHHECKDCADACVACMKECERVIA